MAEHLALEDGLGHRAAIQRDKRAFGTAGQRMQAARHQFLAGAGLAVDHHRHVGGRDIGHQRAHLPDRGRAADDARARRRAGQFAAQRAAHGVGEAVGTEGFFDKVVGAFAHGLHGHGDVAMAGHQDHRHARRGVAAVLQQVQAAGAGQAHVGHHHAGKGAVQVRDRGLGGGQRQHREAGQLQALRGGLTHQRLVFDKQDTQTVLHGNTH